MNKKTACLLLIIVLVAFMNTVESRKIDVAKKDNNMANRWSRIGKRLNNNSDSVESINHFIKMHQNPPVALREQVRQLFTLVIMTFDFLKYDFNIQASQHYDSFETTRELCG